MIYDHEGRLLGATPREAAETLNISRKTMYNRLRKYGLTDRWRWQDVTLPAPDKIERKKRAVFELPDGRRVVGLDAMAATLGVSKQRVYQIYRRDQDGIWRAPDRTTR